MKYYEYEKLGVHSRLNNLIKESGGYNYRLAGELLMKEYQLNNKEIAYEMAKNENIRDEINCVGIDAVVDLTKKSILIRKAKLRQCLGLVNRFL